MNFEIRPLSTALGAEVIGLDVSRPIDPLAFKKIHQAHLKYHVLVFREQSLTPREQINFSQRFGTLDSHPSQGTAYLEDFPEILVVSTKKKNGKDVGLRNAGPMWHSDLAYRKEPALGSMLYAIELPNTGGDTGFANMCAAYDALSEKMKQSVDGKRAIFHSTRDPSLIAAHPVVRTHPESGRKSIFVNPQLTSHIKGVDPEMSESLLKALYAHCQQPEFIYWHKWRQGDLTFWDNRCVLHIADHARLDDPTYLRHMHRTTIAGDRPF